MTLPAPWTRQPTGTRTLERRKGRRLRVPPYRGVCPTSDPPHLATPTTRHLHTIRSTVSSLPAVPPLQSLPSLPAPQPASYTVPFPLSPSILRSLQVVTVVGVIIVYTCIGDVAGCLFGQGRGGKHHHGGDDWRDWCAIISHICILSVVGCRLIVGVSAEAPAPAIPSRQAPKAHPQGMTL